MIIYEDEFCIAVNKPNNVLVHHSKMANNKTDEKSLVELLKINYNQKLYPIHRLDRKTSGIILMATEKHYVSKFQKLMTQNKIEKTYLGLVRGFTDEHGIIDSDVKGRDAHVYKTALTEYIMLNKIELNIPVIPYNTSRYSLLKLHPKTGRLHQLRIHMNKINHPLIGDPKYGDRFHNRMFIDTLKCDKLFLHAQKLTFNHPFINKEITITADLPSDWHTIFKKFGWNLDII